MWQFTFPQIDPVAIHLGPLAIRWYALAYIAGILCGLFYLKQQEKRQAFFGPRAFDDLVVYAVLGVLLGGRLGYVLFYQTSYYLAHPVEIFYIWQGGMAFHGGMAGVLVSFYLFARRFKLPYLGVMDRLAIVTPIGLCFGRIANFVNGELVGRPVSENAWVSMVFPHVDALPRHISPLYQAAGEGALLFLIMLLVAHRTAARKHPGMLSGVFAVGYGFLRFLAEFFRMPDAQLGLIAGPFTMGQLLCVPMLAIGLILIWRARKNQQNR